MKRPSFQFYPADWRTNSNLRRCSEAARGGWIDVICVLHDSDEYGVCRWPLEELTRVAGVSPGSMQELIDKGVLKGADANAQPYVHTPRTGNVEGMPVVLVQAEDGNPCWYCSRMVHDEWIRKQRGGGTRFTAENQPNRLPNRPVGTRQGNGATSTSSSSSNVSSSVPTTVGEASARAQIEAPDARATAAAKACKAIMAAGIPANPSHPDLLAAIAEGVTTQEFADAAIECKAKGKQFQYLVATVRGRKAEVSASPAGPPPPPKPSAHLPYKPERRQRVGSEPIPQAAAALFESMGITARDRAEATGRAPP